MVLACAPLPAPNAVPVEASPVQERDVVRPMSFLVSFRPSHALGRAQLLEGEGRHDEAAHLVSIALRDQGLRGLCFEHFTLGGGEIVLNVCAPDRWEEPLITQQRWLEQLGATPGILFAERNFTAQADFVAPS